MVSKVVLLFLIFINKILGLPLADIPQCPADQCGIVLSPNDFGLRYKAVKLRNDVDELNEAEVVITFSGVTDLDVTTLTVGITGAVDDSDTDNAIAIDIPLGNNPNLVQSNSLLNGGQTLDELKNYIRSPFPDAITDDNYVNTDIDGFTSVIVRIGVEYRCINRIVNTEGCIDTGYTIISVKSSSVNGDFREIREENPIDRPGKDVYIYISVSGGDIQIDSISEICENADNYGEGLYCIKNSHLAPRPLACFVAIHAPGYDPTLPHYFQNAKQWLWDDAKDACVNGVIMDGTISLAALHTDEENSAAVAAMKYRGCQSAFFGMQGIQGYNDYEWVDGSDIGTDARLWRGRNDPNAYTADEASVGYMEVLLGDDFPTCGYYFWADECRPVGKHPCAICIKYVTESPTVSPTKLPSVSPTELPTEIPTVSPTKTPTSPPTTSPTKQPSVTPTVSPTKSPTLTPSKVPSKIPTVSPTESPITTPTNAPTNAPSVPPTKLPSTSPTISPTKTPTVSPTILPTISPTKTPTISPTIIPTISPTKAPSISPTKSPSKTPTETPTNTPTKIPSVSPTKSPTKTPSKVPTKSPTYLPSKIPSNVPSVPPTNAPSTLPSVSPTKLPTPSPTPETPCECLRGVQFPRDIVLSPGQDELYQYSAAFATYTIKDDKYASIDISVNDAIDLRLCFNSDCIEHQESQFILSIAVDGSITLGGFDKLGNAIPTVGPVIPTGITSITQITSLHMVWDNDNFDNVGLEGDLVIGLGKQLGGNEIIRTNFNQVFEYTDDNLFIELVATSPNKEDGASIDVCWFGSIQYNCEIEAWENNCDIDTKYLIGQFEGFNFNCVDNNDGSKTCEWMDSSDKGNTIDNQYIINNGILTQDYDSQITCVSTDPEFPCDQRNTIAIKGGISDTINLVAPSGLAFLPPLYTLFTVARYPQSAANKGVIFGNDSPRFESGFGPNGEEGYAYHENIEITDSSGNGDNLYDFSLNGNDFLLSSDQRSMYRGNGVSYTVNTPINDADGIPIYSPFKINPNLNTEFEILEVLIFNVELTQEQIKCIEYKYFEPKYTLVPLYPQCTNVNFPSLLSVPRQSGETGSQFFDFNAGDGSECNNQCIGTVLPDCAGKQTLLNVRATKLTEILDIVWALQAGADFIGGIMALDGLAKNINGEGTGNFINPLGGSVFPSNVNLASSDSNPLELVNINNGLQRYSNIGASVPIDGGILLTFEINQYWMQAKTILKIYNYEEEIFNVEYDTLFEPSSSMYLRLGLDTDNTPQQLMLDNLRKQTLCFDVDYVNQIFNPAAKRVSTLNQDNGNTKLNGLKNNVSSNKLYLILFILTVLFNVVIIGFTVIIWNKGAGNNIMLLFKSKTKGYATFFDDSSDNETDHDQDILVPAKKYVGKNKKGYNAIAAQSESDME